MTYVLNTEWSNQSVADRACRSQGSVLVTYYTVREQVGGAARRLRASLIHLLVTARAPRQLA
jgi:hypothetical protein